MRFGHPTRATHSLDADSVVFADFRRSLVAAVQRLTGALETVGFALTPGFGPLLALGAVRWLVRDRTVRTYAIGFGADDHFIGQAQDIARHFCTEHQTIIVTAAEVHAALHELVRHTEDPCTPEHVLELLLIARYATSTYGLPILIDGFAPAQGLGPACERLQLATRIPLQSLFHDPQARASWMRVFCTEDLPPSLWPEVMRHASAGMLAPELLRDPVFTRRAHPSRDFARQLQELSVDVLSGVHSVPPVAEVAAGRPAGALNSLDGTHCLPPVDWARLVSALCARDALRMPA